MSDCRHCQYSKSHQTEAERQCDCPINYLQSINGEFSLKCGSDPFKIFDSDIPSELFIEIYLDGYLTVGDSCELKVTVDLENGDTITNIIPRVSSSQRNSFQFYGKTVRRITLTCQNGNSEVSSCSGRWTSQIFFRGSSKNKACGCPVFLIGDGFTGRYLPSQNSRLLLPCGNNENTIFTSDETVEMFGELSLISNSSGCDLQVTVETENGMDLVFMIPDPYGTVNGRATNKIHFHTEKTKKISARCIGGEGSGCEIVYTTYLALRDN